MFVVGENDDGMHERQIGKRFTKGSSTRKWRIVGIYGKDSAYAARLRHAMIDGATKEGGDAVVVVHGVCFERPSPRGTDAI